jgi:hypothetical protein
MENWSIGKRIRDFVVGFGLGGRAFPSPAVALPAEELYRRFRMIGERKGNLTLW